jgi:lipoyl-dependent peroxiredoxin
MAATRQAKAIWEGDLMSGAGRVSAVSSGLFTDAGVSWVARSEAAGGKTSPEELLAAAHASCFCMALSAGLAKAGTPPQKLEVTVDVTFEKGVGVKSSAIRAVGTVAGVDAAGFQKAAEAAKDGCPISKALAGNVQLSVEASLA